MKTRSFFTLVLLAVAALALIGAGTRTVAPLPVAPQIVVPPGCTFVGTLQNGHYLLECVPTTPTPTVTASSTATLVPSTATVAPSATPLPPTASPTPLPPSATATKPAPTASNTPTSPAPTATATATATLTATVGPTVGMRPVNPLLLGTCTAAVHDRYVVVVNGNTYRTWHPQIVPVDLADPSKGTCAFAHEHGDNPATSLANSTMPPFELIADLAGLVEPHEGYKVFVANKGAVNNDTRTALTSNRMVVHMGSSGASRFYVQFHSLIVDMVAPDGHFVHTQGLGDFGTPSDVSNICAQPRVDKTAMSIPGSDGCVPQSDYEIWQGSFTVFSGKYSIVTVKAAPAVFDPISLRNPLDAPGIHPLYLTKNYAALAPRLFGNGPWKGCKREGYVGPIYWYNGGGEQTQFTTDVYGKVMVGGPLLQQVSLHSDIGIPMTTDFGISPDQTQFKNLSNNCASSALLGDLN